MEENEISDRNESVPLKSKTSCELQSKDDICQANGYDSSADSPSSAKENGTCIDSSPDQKMDMNNSKESDKNSDDSVLALSPISVNGSDEKDSCEMKESKTDNGLDNGNHCDKSEAHSGGSEEPMDCDDIQKEKTQNEDDDAVILDESSQEHSGDQILDDDSRESATNGEKAVNENSVDSASVDMADSKEIQAVSVKAADHSQEGRSKPAVENVIEEDESTNSSKQCDDLKDASSKEKSPDVIDFVVDEKDTGADESSRDSNVSKKTNETSSDAQNKDDRGCDSPIQSIELSQRADEIIVLDDDEDSPVKVKKRKVENKESAKKEVDKEKSQETKPADKIVNGSAAAEKEVAKPESEKTQGTPVTSDPAAAAAKAVKPPVPEFAQDLRPMALNLCTIGMNLVREHVYNDLIKIQSKKLSQNKLNDMAKKQLDIIKTAATALKADNEPIQSKLHTCKYDSGDGSQCGFQSESLNVMEFHNEHPHVYFGRHHCGYCKFVGLSRKDYQFHMEAVHNKRVRFVQPFAYLVCCFCKYETDNAKAFNKHVIKCSKVFSLKRNQEPSPADCDIPLKKPKKAVPTQTVKQTRSLLGNKTLAERTYMNQVRPPQPAPRPTVPYHQRTQPPRPPQGNAPRPPQGSVPRPPQSSAPARPAYQFQPIPTLGSRAPVSMAQAVAAPGAPMLRGPMVPGSQACPFLFTTV